MRIPRNTILLAGALVVLTVGAIRAGETVIYRGTEIYGAATETLTALPTGDTVVLERSTVVLTSEASPEGGFEGKCLALGLLTETGDDSREAYCPLHEIEGNSLV